MDSEFRQLDTRERGLLEKESRDELRAQMGMLTARQALEDGTLVLRCESGPRAPGKYALVAEGICKDADGSDIAVLLHVGKGGFMRMLEIIKYDGSPIINPPSASDLVLLLPESGGWKPSQNLH